MNKFNICDYSITIEGNLGNNSVLLSGYEEENGLVLMKMKVVFESESIPPILTLKWMVPDIEMHSQWNPVIGFNRGIQTDWSGAVCKSKSTFGAPVLTTLNYNGENKLTIAVSDALNPIGIKSLLNEEKANLACEVIFFDGPMQPLKQYEAVIRLDSRAIPYYESLEQVAEWWSAMPNYKPASVPEYARLPMYSPWYSFHQNFKQDEIVKQCKLAKKLGCESVIIDDGWQTEDNNRGYAYCGDWNVAESKIPSMKEFVSSVHEAGMKFLLWYSVPFVGEKSKAYTKFEGKYLHYRKDLAAYVLDPRFPGVREYLINIYEKAVREWDLDGLKLDFVDEFSLWEDSKTPFSEDMDYNSVNEAVDRLLKDTLTRLHSLKQDFMIEFRQSYIGPLMRTYGNMFRAADCPNDSLRNRQETIDIRLLSGNTAVHSDPQMWNKNDTVESAAFQFINALYSVPQISVRIDEITENHYKMLAYWLKFWKENRDVLLDGKFTPIHPEANYTTSSASNDKKLIATAYCSPVISISDNIYEEIILINGTYEKRLLLESSIKYNNLKLRILNCCGEIISENVVTIEKGINCFEVPPAGTIRIKS